MSSSVLAFYRQIYFRITSSTLLLGSFWTIIGGGISRVCLVAGSILTAHTLGPEKFGEFGITRSTINMILVLAGLNVGSVLTKYIAEFKDRNIDKCKVLVTQNYLFVFSLAVLLSLTVFLSAGFMSEEILEAPHLEEEIKLSVIVIFFGITFPLNESVFRGFQWFKELGLLQGIGSLTFLVFVPIGALYYGVYGALLGYLFYTLVMTGLTSFRLYKHLKNISFKIFTLDSKVTDFRLLKKMTIPIFFASLIEAPFFWAAQVLLIKATGMVENGLVNAVLQIRGLALIIPGYITLVSLPLLSNTLIESKGEDLQYKGFLKKTLLLNFIIATTAIIPLICFPAAIMSSFGKGFEVGYWTSFWAYMSVPFLVVAGVLNQSMIAKNLGWVNLYISLTWNILFIAMVYLLVTIYGLGALGYMISLFIAIVVFTVLKFYFNRQN